MIQFLVYSLRQICYLTGYEKSGNLNKQGLKLSVCYFPFVATVSKAIIILVPQNRYINYGSYSLCPHKTYALYWNARITFSLFAVCVEIDK